MNQLGDALTELDAPPVKVLFVYNSNPVATIPNQAQGARRARARRPVHGRVRRRCGPTPRGWPTSCCPRPRSSSTPSWRAATARTCCRQARPVVEPVGEARSNNAVFGELVRRLGLARAGDPESEDAVIDALLASASDGPRLRADMARDGRAFPAFGPAPIQFVRRLPAHAGRQDRSVPGGAGPGGARRALRLSARSGDGGGAAGADLAGVGPHHQLDVRAAVPRPGSPRAAPDDARARGIAEGDRVRVFNTLGEVRCRASINADLRAGVAMLPKGLWSRHTDNGATANALCPDTLTDLGGGACFNDARVEVERIG